MNPREFTNLAARLAAGVTPAESRTAISRAYYAVFNVGAEALRGMGFTTGKGAAAHGEIQKCLGNSGDPAIATVASKLNDLHASRNRADYQLDRTDVEKSVNARAAVMRAEEMIQTLDAAFGGPQRTQLQATIQKWRRDNGYL